MSERFQRRIGDPMKVQQFNFLLLCSAVISVAATVRAVEPQRPAYRREQVLLKAQDFEDAGEMAYLAFPDIIRVDERDILISFKRGRSHASDPGAVAEAVRFNTATNEVDWRGILGEEPGRILQMGEWIEFPDGRIANFVDVQHLATDNGGERNHRSGVYWTRSDDRWQTFTPVEKLGAIDGVEYGYVFDGVISGQRVYLLAMSFPELSERRSVFDEQGRRLYGEVSVLATDDNGGSWRHVRNLSREFGGASINESALVAVDDGFLVCTRGYDSQARLQRVDHAFRLQQARNLTRDFDCIGGHISRPRLFARDGRLYLLGRNTRGGLMELALFRIEPASLAVETCSVLDPEVDGVTIKDGYYAVPYFQDSDDGPLLQVITYRRPDGQANPDLIRLEFRWDELR